MSKITNEWLQQKIADMEAAQDEIPFGLDEEDSNTLAAMRIALASLELERGMIRRFDLDMSDCDSCGQDCGADMVEDLDGEYVLWDEVLPYLYRYDEYTAPAAPISVPDELTREEYKRRFMEDDNFDDTFRGGWNACRAAMLQGAEPDFREISNSSTNNCREIAETSTNCPCCGRKQLKNRTCSVSGCDGKHVARGFCVKHYALERKKDPSRRESIRAADKRYRARKTAAPQQEVKNG